MKENFTKVITMYLPQFHRTKENDIWWGEGFTEWTTVKMATPLLEKQYQPRVPLNENYYDLLEKEVMLHQVELMKKYKVYGQCFYHYWFKDGKMILEKPAENLIKWQDVDMPFCFSWANETWARTWSNLGDANTWAIKFEDLSENQTKGDAVLLEQDYGTEDDWKKHFEYLLPFFQDERYIKIGEKPMFIIYRPHLVPCMQQMIACWQMWAKEAGIPGIYFIGTNVPEKPYFDAILWQESQHSRPFVEGLREQGVFCYDYDQLWISNLMAKGSKDTKVFFGGFVDYDDTPRHGDKGSLCRGASPEKFRKYLSLLLGKSKKFNNEYVFINAWNEWGEGMYLEPDERYGYAYLEAVRDADETNYNDVEWIIEAASERENYLLKQNRRYEEFWTILNRWMGLTENNIGVDSFFKERKIKTVAIYGLGMLGRHLCKALKDTEVKVLFGIDRNYKNINERFPVYGIEEEYPEVDAVVVTVTYDFDDIYYLLKDKVHCPVISLREAIDGRA